MTILAYATLVISNPPRQSELYKVGWNAYCNGYPYDQLVTAAERRGYMAANRAHAEMLTAGYADMMEW